VSSDCTGFESGILSLQKLGLGPRVTAGFASDTELHVRKYLDDNFQHTQIFHDVTKRNNMALKRQLVKDGRVPDIYTAGFPCQPFSSAGLRAGASDPRGVVGLSVADTIKTLQPKCFVLENVPGILQKKHKPLLDAIIRKIQAVKDTKNLQMYDVTMKVLNCSDYGVAQSRRRLYIVGYKKSLAKCKFKWPQRIPMTMSFIKAVGKLKKKATLKLPTAMGTLRRLLEGMKRLPRKRKQRSHYIIDIDSSNVSIRKDMCPCITRTRGSSGGFYLPAHGERLGVTRMAKFMSIPIKQLDMTNVTKRQQGMMLGNAWALNVSSAVIKNLVLCMGFATEDEMVSV
jgi:DNA-cytosine methyltransferase